MNRLCHLCGTTVPAEEFCPACVTAFASRRNAEEMTGEERAAEMRAYSGPLEIPFDLMHQRFEELVGRPVWTHELGLRYDALIEEARTRQHATFTEVLECIPAEKRVVVMLEEPR